MFKIINEINDLLPAVTGKKEIRFAKVYDLGVTVGCYMFMDSKTFDSPESIECRGIAFDSSGKIVSRPLHKFFNVGERPELSLEKLSSRALTTVYEKLDGSMLATAWVNGKLEWRSKKSFNSDVVKLARSYVKDNPRIEAFATEVASSGMTAVFELQHPAARIVVPSHVPKMTLLHVRDNVTGQYVLLDPLHNIHDMVRKHGIEKVRSFHGVTIEGLLETLGQMKNKEGYVLHFADGDMAKIKCPWYLRLHKSITFLRERDIALLSIKEELDDLKSSLKELEISLESVERVESRLKNNLLAIFEDVENSYNSTKTLSRKDFAIAHKDNPYFALLMQRFTKSDFSVSEWYIKNRLKEDFSLESLLSPAQTEAAEG